MTHYTVYVVPYGSSAKNAGIVTNMPAMRSKWTEDGKLTYVPYDDGRLKFEFDAQDDTRAYENLTVLLREKRPADKRPISGKSYLRHCRPSFKASGGAA